MRIPFITLTAGLILSLSLLPEASAGQGRDKTDRHNVVEPATASNPAPPHQAESANVQPSSAGAAAGWIDAWMRLFSADNPECLGTQCGRPAE
jgi:hypothetical protein